ncbi:MAG: hypothetical protein WC471_00810 [Candidatus Woesearchaeota archaeon]
MFNRKAQEGGGSAAILVALIALFILVYLLFVPPSVRLEILEGDGTETDSSDDEVTVNGAVLLRENPGSVVEEGSTSLSHSMPSLNLYTKSEGKVLENLGGVAIARSDFSSTLKSYPFTISNLGNVNNVMLTFNVITSEGNLIVKLNGVEILNKQVTGSVEPIVIAKGLLKENNLLDFDVTYPGWRFWAKNDYELSAVALRADVTDTEHKKATTQFYIDSEEKSSLRSALLYFFPYCGANADTMTMKINGNQVFRGTPQCGYSNRFELSPEQLQSGENNVEFDIAGGSYTITQLKINTELKAKKNTIYHFEISDKQYVNITDRDYDVYVSLKFPLDYERREGKLYINSDIKSYDTSDSIFQYKITDFVREGFNSVRIVPEASYEIDEIKVWLKK